MPAIARWHQLDELRRARMRYWIEAVDSPAPLDHVAARLERSSEYQQLAASWDRLDAAARQRAAARLDELFRAAAYATRPYCRRCGACCRHAGPTLFPGDEELVRGGVLRLDQLVTHRAGEEVYSHATGERTVLERECVMVAPAPRAGCPLHELASCSCTIHEQRPRQCRAQRCWDPDEGLELATAAGLGRLDLLAPGSPWGDLVARHERACSAQRLRALLAATTRPSAAIAADVAAMVAEDQLLRDAPPVSPAPTAAALRFLLGRPVEALLGQLGWQLVPAASGAATLARVAVVDRRR